MQTNYGLEFELWEPERLNDFEGYDKTVASCHIQNCGKIIVSAQYGDPIDNEYDLAAIYEQLENEQSK